MNAEHCKAYTLLQEQQIDDIHAHGYLLRHNKSGARVLLLENEDDNKVFNIAFRTPPADSTGVAHILEHSVLCGSREFPLKDPFVELVKGSLNTFLNAMTYPDKTMYPVASTNDADFQNLMHVYMDAVFYPNIYKHDEIFRQEGWSYHLESEDGPLTYNGVVYNEMKGAFSSADDVLERETFNTLFPDTPYGVESGGDPSCIPNLTYENFLKFHQTYYHPSNSYIYLYGNMDMEEKLAWMDEKYLSHFDAKEVKSEIPYQKPFAETLDIVHEYPVLDGDPLENNAYLSYNMVIGSGLDVKLNVAFSVLEYALLDAPGAPVKQALLDAHIGKDVYGSYEDGILQPFFSIVAKNADENEKEKFLSIIRGTLEDIVKNGMDQKAIEAGINYFEFRFREADFSSFPKGLMYGIDVFDSWLYDENKPFAYLQQLAIYDELKKLAKEGYFENLIQTYLLDNTHAWFREDLLELDAAGLVAFVEDDHIDAFGVEAHIEVRHLLAQDFYGEQRGVLFYIGFCKLLGCFFFGKHVYLIIKGFRIALYVWEFCDLGKGHINDFHALEFLHGEAVVYCHLWLSPFFALRGRFILKISM